MSRIWLLKFKLSLADNFVLSVCVFLLDKVSLELKTFVFRYHMCLKRF